MVDHNSIIPEDLNGDFHLGSLEGELLVTVPKNTYVFPHDFPVAANPFEE